MAQICNRCVLDSNFPGIHLDEAGVCNFCRSLKSRIELSAQKKKYEEKFVELIEKHRGKGPYECLVAYSGGKDSTYTLALMKRKYNLKLLAFSFDNWFQSKRTFENIKNVIAHLDVDHITVTPSFNSFREMLSVSVNQDLYSRKALERASSICTTCLSLVRFSGLKIAIEKEIPFVALGMSPGQAPIATSIFKMNSSILRSMQNAIFRPLYGHLGSMIEPYFLEERHFVERVSYPYSMNPLAFLGYDEGEMLHWNKELGWEAPGDTDPNSTNCLLNTFANQVHQDKYGFHPYAFEIAGLVREGYMTREAGLAKLSAAPNEEIIQIVKGKLGIS